MQTISMWTSVVVLVAAAGLTACDATPTMTARTPTVTAGSNVIVGFDNPLGGPAANQYWITILPATAPESDATGRRFVYHGDTSAQILAPAAGTYEIRLHDQFPKKEHHLIAKTSVLVVPKGE
ncbi:MAG: hypothetical protein ABI461_14530 [Polyangiaceae bacterium]